MAPLQRSENNLEIQWDTWVCVHRALLLVVHASVYNVY